MHFFLSPVEKLNPEWNPLMSITSYFKEMIVGKPFCNTSTSATVMLCGPEKHNVGEVYHHKMYGTGKVVICEPFKDEISKQKFWRNTVRFTKLDGSQIDVVFKRNAAATSILVFPGRPGSKNSILPTIFPLALLKGTFEEQLGDQKQGVDLILKK
jgi:hypothetical protein